MCRAGAAGRLLRGTVMTVMVELARNDDDPYR